MEHTSCHGVRQKKRITDGSGPLLQLVIYCNPSKMRLSGGSHFKTGLNRFRQFGDTKTRYIYDLKDCKNKMQFRTCLIRPKFDKCSM